MNAIAERITPRRQAAKKTKLTRAEVLAVHACVKAGLRMKRTGYFYRSWMDGYWTALRNMSYSLPETRKTVRVTRFWDRMTKRMERINEAHAKRQRKEI